MSKEKVKETKIPVPIPRVIMLSNGQQVIAGVTATEGSSFVRLHEPYKIRIHEAVVGKEQLGFVEERMSLTPLVFQTTDTIYSVLRNQILTIGSPNKNLTEYYNNVRMGLFPSMKKEIEPIKTKMSIDQQFDEMMEKMNDEEYFDMIDYLKGNKTKQ
tara:strand:- start:647 stop:1117 length:471 start_codon:yes stop_codon:yes gene_type:complete